MTELLYQTNSYLKEVQAKVVRVEEEAVILDKTILFPGGGGQPGDAGMLIWDAGESPIKRVKRIGDEVLHWLEGSLPDVSTKVTCQLDWERRYKFMRIHTALHILCAVIWRDFGARVTGGNMELLTARMDFELESLSADFADRVEVAINKEVEAARPVQVKILPREDAFKIPDLIRTKINLLPESIQMVRTVEIVGLDLQADGGTHVANTREVGKIKIVGHMSKGRFNKRLRIRID